MCRRSIGRKLRSAASGESGARGRGTNIQDVRGVTGNQLNNNRRTTSNRSTILRQQHAASQPEQVSTDNHRQPQATT